MGFSMSSCRNMKGYDVATWLHVALSTVSACRGCRDIIEDELQLERTRCRDMEPITTNLLLFFSIFAPFACISILICKRKAIWGFSMIRNDKGVNLASKSYYIQEFHT